MFSFAGSMLINLAMSLVPQLTGTIRGELVVLAKSWNISSQDTPTPADDIVSALCRFLLDVGNPESATALTAEMKEGLDVLYKLVKQTKNPYDDVVVGALYLLSGLETPLV